MKSNHKKVNAINIDVEWLFKCTKENEIQIMEHGGRKRVIVGLQGTKKSKLHDFYNLSRESVQNYKWLPSYPQKLKISRCINIFGSY